MVNTKKYCCLDNNILVIDTGKDFYYACYSIPKKLIKKLKNQNPIESLLESQHNIPDVIYLCEQGLGHLLNEKVLPEEIYDEGGGDIVEVQQQTLVVNHYFQNIIRFKDTLNEITNFLNDYCLENRY